MISKIQKDEKIQEQNIKLFFNFNNLFSYFLIWNQSLLVFNMPINSKTQCISSMRDINIISSIRQFCLSNEQI